MRERQRNATVPAVQRFGTCAVVGNSGTLLQKQLGKEIDAHDAVRSPTRARSSRAHQPHHSAAPLASR